MRKLFALAAIATMTMGLSALAAETGQTTSTTTHTAESMSSGHHMMPGNKQNHMSNKMMPSMNPKCSDEALAKMPPDHRAACQRKN